MAAEPVYGVGWNVNGVGWRPAPRCPTCGTTATKTIKPLTHDHLCDNGHYYNDKPQAASEKTK